MKVTDINWNKIKDELLKVRNIEDLKHELNEIAKEIQKIDINEHLSPTAKKKLTRLEKKYQEIVDLIHKYQKQFDREFNKALRNLKQTKVEAEKQIKKVKKTAKKHKKKIDKASKKAKSNFKKKIKKATKKKATKKTKARKKKTTTKKKTSKKA